MASFFSKPLFSGSRLKRNSYERPKGDAFSASDITAVVYGVDKTTKQEVVTTIGEIQTLSYSIHKEVAPVRTLGRSEAAAYVDGTRTIAGSLIFATFHRRALEELYSGATAFASRTVDKIQAKKEGNAEHHLLSEAKIKRPSDTIPPFDIILYFTSEAGNDSVLTISRVKITNEGQTFSVQDIYMEHTMQYVAGSISLMEKIKDQWQHGEGLLLSGTFQNVKAIRRSTSQGFTAL